MTCPICDREATPKYKPFCSRRCADADLGRWLEGTYRIPAETNDTVPPEPDPDLPN